jgi:transposase
MHSNIISPGLEEAIILKTEVRANQYLIHFKMPIKPHSCPCCKKETQRIHDYRITKIKHLKFGERMTTLFYRKRRYVWLLLLQNGEGCIHSIAMPIPVCACH